MRTLRFEPFPGCAPEIGRLLWALEDTRRRTLRHLEGLTPALLDWQPPEDRSNTIGAILFHLAAIELDYVYADVRQEGFPEAVWQLLPYDVRDETGLLTAVRNHPLDHYLSRLAAARAHLLDTFRPMDLADFRRLRQPAGCDYEATPEWVLHHLIQHEAEHRGELATLRARASIALEP